MGLGILSFLRSAVEPVTRVIDEVHTSAEEKLKVQQAMAEMESLLTDSFLDYEKQKLQAQADVIKAEAQGRSWLQRNWRPLLMLVFTLIIVNNYLLTAWFNTPMTEIPPDMWGLLKIGVGGYVVARSAEKIAPDITKAVRARSEGSRGLS